MLTTLHFAIILGVLAIATILSVVLIILSIKDNDDAIGLIGLIFLIPCAIGIIPLICQYRFDNKSHIYDVYKITCTTETNQDTISKQEYHVYVVEDETNLLRITCDEIEKVEYEIGQTFVAYRKDLGDFEKLN